MTIDNKFILNCSLSFTNLSNYIRKGPFVTAHIVTVPFLAFVTFPFRYEKPSFLLRGHN